MAGFLGELMGVRFPDDEDLPLQAARRDARLMGDQMRRAWEDFLAAECAAGPVLMVLEDMQWGDAPSVRMIDGALRVLEALSCMVLAVGRPEVSEVFPNLWRARGAEVLRVGELSVRAAERLVRYHLGDSIAPLRVQQLVAKADGNAFYLVEILRAEADGRGEHTPRSVMAMVEARLGAMEPEARQVLRAASVFGQAFWEGGVRAPVGDGVSAPSVESWLAELTRREVIVARTESALEGEREYAFAHALLRQAAYGMLLDADQSLGHRLAGAWLERAGEREPLALAEHYERGERPERAAGHYLRAAVQALEGNDLPAALARAERGIACGGANEVPGALRAVEAAAHKWRGEMDLAAARGAEALRCLPAGSARWYEAAREQAAVCGNRGDTDGLVSLAEVICGDGGEMLPARAAAAAQLAMHLTFAGRSEVGRVFAWLDAVASTTVGSDPVAAAAIAEASGARAMVAGDPARCHAQMSLAADLRASVGDLRGQCIARGNASFAAIVLGAYDEAEAALRETIATAERLGLSVVGAHAEQNLASVLVRRGALAEARALAERSAAAYQAQHSLRAEGFARTYLAEALARAGDLDGAVREARAAVEAFAAVPPGRAYALAVLANVRRAQGATTEALGYARDAAARMDSLGGIDEGEGIVQLAYAQALAAAGDDRGAREALTVARDRLLERAARIGDLSWRERFLTNVDENARTLAWASEMR